jgi:hypothetical protein
MKSIKAADDILTLFEECSLCETLALEEFFPKSREA